MGASGVVCRAPPHSSGEPQHRTFPLLNLHRARVRRKHGRPRSNGFIERAQNTPPDFTAQSQRASDKALTFIGTWGYGFRLQAQSLQLLSNIDYVVGDPIEKSR